MSNGSNVDEFYVPAEDLGDESKLDEDINQQNQFFVHQQQHAQHILQQQLQLEHQHQQQLFQQQHHAQIELNQHQHQHIVYPNQHMQSQDQGQDQCNHMELNMHMMFPGQSRPLIDANPTMDIFDATKKKRYKQQGAPLDDRNSTENPFEIPLMEEEESRETINNRTEIANNGSTIVRVGKMSRSSKAYTHSNSNDISENTATEGVAVADLPWDTHYSALLIYLEKYGHCNVPQKAVFDCVLPGAGPAGTDLTYGGKLGRWLDLQRRMKKGRRGTGKLTPEREALLQALVDQGHLLWDASAGKVSVASKRAGDLSWPRHFAALLKYCEKYGHCNIPSNQGFECILNGMAENGSDLHYNSKLGQWLNNQKRKKRGTLGNCRLDLDREAALQELVDRGLLVWDSRDDDFEEVYQDERENCDDGFSAEGFPIPFQQLSALEEVKSTGLTGARKKLSTGTFSSRKNRIKRGVVLDNGGLGSGIVADYVLALGTNSAENSGIKRKPVKDDLAWPRHYAALKKYGEEHGHCNIPQAHTYECVLEGMGEEGEGSNLQYRGKLGQWLTHQRHLKTDPNKNDRLSTERQALLQELVDQGLLVWDVSGSRVSVKNKLMGDVTWPRHFAALLKYGEEHGHCNIPSNHSYQCVIEGDQGTDGIQLQYQGNLGQWLNNQRRKKRGTMSKGRARLSPEREALLQELVDQGLLNWDANSNLK